MTNDFRFLRINETFLTLIYILFVKRTEKQFKPYVFNPCNEKLLFFYNSFYVCLFVPKHTANGSFSAL